MTRQTPVSRWSEEHGLLCSRYKLNTDGQTEGQQLLTQTHPLTGTHFSCLTRTTQNLNPKMLRVLRIQENLLFASVKTLVTYFCLLLWSWHSHWFSNKKKRVRILFIGCGWYLSRPHIPSRGLPSAPGILRQTETETACTVPDLGLPGT